MEVTLNTGVSGVCPLADFFPCWEFLQNLIAQMLQQRSFQHMLLRRRPD